MFRKLPVRRELPSSLSLPREIPAQPEQSHACAKHAQPAHNGQMGHVFGASLLQGLLSGGYHHVRQLARSL